MQETANLIPIGEGDLLPYVKRAETDLVSVEWRPKKKEVLPTTSGRPTLLGPTITAEVATEKMSLIQTARSFCGGDQLLSERVHHVLSILKRSLQIGFHIEALYVKASGLELLERQNSAGNLPKDQQSEFNAKQTTRAAVSLWSIASYVVWELSGYRTEETSGMSMETPAIPECPLQNTISARRAALFYLGRGLSDESINTEVAFVKYALLYFRAILAEIKLREGQLQFTAPFTDRKYKLEGSEFILDGFKMQEDRSVVSVEFNRTNFSEIVGNKVAKHNSMRTIMRLLCYDLEQKQNPMRELGGLAAIRLGFGKPGTGKSMLIAAIATALDERAKWLKIPFLFHPLPDTLISTYQGGSAERMMAWMSVLSDPTKLIYAPVDDAENNLEERTRQGVSAGVREVIGVFLRNTEGAYAVNRGNTLIDVCTNLPEQVDRAVMSRIVERYAIEGAETRMDFIDQDRGWWLRFHGISPDFIGMKDPEGYEYFADQRVMTSLSKDGERYLIPRNSRIAEIFDETRKKFSVDRQEFFGELYQNVRKQYPWFTSRDVRNIQSAVSSRVLDFDFPEEWLDDPKYFFAHSYDVKKGMLIELLRSNMGGVSFSDLRLEEALRYLDGMAGIADVDFEREVERMVRQIRVHTEAAKRSKLGT